MPRFKIIIEYDGTPFAGWQIQKNGPSVQAALAEAIQKMMGEDVQVFGAGRTDSGVHARGQVAHFDVSQGFTANKVRDGLNHHLKPLPVAVLHAESVDEAFNARFSATKRHYLYRIINRRAPLTLDKHLAWRVAKNLDADAMHEAAQCLAGKHDYTTFRSVHCQAQSPVKSIDEIAVRRNSDEVLISVSARSFLHNQVRSIAGSLVQVGEGKWTVEHFRSALVAADRKACGPVAPPHGLYLVKVDY